ncbi:MAG: hypothetical protein AAFO77_03035 [Pseudomonadota bacterium]
MGFSFVQFIPTITACQLSAAQRAFLVAWIAGIRPAKGRRPLRKPKTVGGYRQVPTMSTYFDAAEWKKNIKNQWFKIKGNILPYSSMLHCVTRRVAWLPKPD